MNRWIDISFPYYQGMGIYPGNPEYRRELVQEIAKGSTSNVSQITMGSHTGTHIDAPLHFLSDGKSVDRISLERMNGLARLLDMCGMEQIEAETLKREKLQTDDIVLLKTDNTEKFHGDQALSNYVTLTYEAAEYLADIGVKMVGIDYMSIERPRESRMPGRSVHRILLEADIIIAEALSLGNVFAGRYELFCFPLCLQGADGAPVRIVLRKMDCLVHS